MTRASAHAIGSILALAACAAPCPASTATAGGELPLRDPTTAPDTMQLAIGGLANGRFSEAQVYSGFGCTGGNRSPQLDWSGAPEGTQSFAIVMHDPDAPTGVGFFHWIVLDLPGATTHLDEAEPMPEGVVEAHTDFGAAGYGGPCPPPGGPHRYEITIYALDVPSTGLPAASTGALVRAVIRDHTLAIGRATATWGR